MDWVASNVRQGHNYARLLGTRVYAIGSKYLLRGSTAFSTPRVPHATPAKPPSWWKNMKNTVKAFLMPPTLILGTDTVQVLVGSATNTAKESVYSDYHVTHVLNCADKEDHLPVFYQECVEAYHHLSLRDESDEKASFVTDPRFHTDLRDFLHSVFTKDRDASHPATLLVHCVFGRSRSVAICIVILFLYYEHTNQRKTMVECYSQIGRLRKVVALQRRFLVELNKFEHEFHTCTEFRENWLSIFD